MGTSSAVPVIGKENKPIAPKQGYVVQFTEDEARRALVETRGEIFLSAQMLGVTALRMKRAIEASEVLQATMEEVEQTDKRKNVTDAQIHRAIEARLALYRVTGLDALHDLATMPIDSENSANNQVKLAAAARLAGSTEVSSGGNDMAETLRELQKSYDLHAPRLRVVRERTTVEVVGRDPTVISQVPEASE